MRRVGLSLRQQRNPRLMRAARSHMRVPSGCVHVARWHDARGPYHMRQKMIMNPCSSTWVAARGARVTRALIVPPAHHDRRVEVLHHEYDYQEDQHPLRRILLELVLNKPFDRVPALQLRAC